MNELKTQLNSTLQFVASIVGTLILAIFLGVIGALVHDYIGIAIFILIVATGVIGSIKLLLEPSVSK